MMRITFNQLRQFRGRCENGRLGRMTDILFSNMTHGILFFRFHLHPWTFWRDCLIPYSDIPDISLHRREVTISLSPNDLKMLSYPSCASYEEVFSQIHSVPTALSPRRHKERDWDDIDRPAPALYHARQLLDCALEAENGVVGFVDDLLIDIDRGTIPFLIISRQTPMGTEHFLCPYFVLREINEGLRTLFSSLHREDFLAIPAYTTNNDSHGDMKIWRQYALLMQQHRPSVTTERMG